MEKRRILEGPISSVGLLSREILRTEIGRPSLRPYLVTCELSHNLIERIGEWSALVDCPQQPVGALKPPD